MEIKNQIKKALGVAVVDKHSKYLGLPTVIGLNKREVFGRIDEVMQKKLTDWKHMILSFAGKETLIKSSLQAVPIFAMQCFKVPKTFCNSMLASELRFLWSNNGNDRSIHWTNRETILKEKDLRGLGIRDFEFFNIALLMKQAWRLLKKPDILMSRIMKARYFATSNFLDSSLGWRPSHAWKSIFMTKDILIQGLSRNREEDEYVWKLTSSGEFDCKTAYKLIKEIREASGTVTGESSDSARIKGFWNKVWKLTIPNKIKVFC
ncbi:hypothetical protein QQ045_016698 [Rhodiola kirilowii]